MPKPHRRTHKPEARGSLFHQYAARVDATTALGQKKRDAAPDAIRSIETRKTYLNAGHRFCAWAKAQGCKALGDVDLQTVQTYLAARQAQGLSAYTLHTERAALVKVLGYSSADIPLPARATAKITRSRGPEPTIAPQHQDLVEFLQASGLRRNEARCLERRDIDIAAGTIQVRRGKGGRSRTVTLLDTAVLDALKVDALRPTQKVLVVPHELDIHRQRRVFAQTLFRQLAGGAWGDPAIDKPTATRAAGAVAVALGHSAHRIHTVKRHYLS